MYFYRVRKRAFLVCFTIAVTALGFSISVSTASQFGRTGFSGNPQTNGGSTCVACHAVGAGEPTVLLSGPTAVDAGSTHLYTVTLTGGPAVAGGVNVSTKDLAGSLAAIDADLRLLDGELAHTVPKSFTDGTLQFNFEWTAPAYNHDSTMYVAGNSSNGQGDLIGDGIGTTALAISVQNGTDEAPTPPEVASANVSLTLFAEGLNAPVSVVHAGDARLFAVEQPGRIRVIEAAGNVLANPFLDVEERVDDASREEGLLGLAFHPNYATNGYFYVNYTMDPGEETGRTRISRFTVSDDPNVADPESELVIMEFEQWADNHNGGDIAFGPDGYLYIASGDGGGGGDTENNGQNPNTLLGAILRIDVDTLDDTQNGPDCDLSGNANYSIPPANAYVDGAAGAGCDEIFALGLRNPWRMSFDRFNGDLWTGDVGQNEFEEINRIPGGVEAGWNLGWRCYEGNADFYTNGCNDQSEYVFPVYDYGRDDGCSVTGGYVYRGAQNPSLWGKYFFSDFCNTEIRTLSKNGERYEHAVAHDGSNLNSIAAFAEDVTGELYAVSTGRGALYRIAEVAPPVPQVASVLIFHRTTGFRHDSIGAGIEMIERFGAANGWSVDDSQEAGDINAANLARYDSVIFLNSTGGDLLNDEQVEALVNYVRAGGGFVGVHGATDALYASAQYESLLGVLIDVNNRHSPNNTFVNLNVASHPANQNLPNPFEIEDELYNFNYQPPTTYLLTVDEATYSGHNGIGGANHALAWLKNEGEGCVFYSSLGHDAHLYSGTDLMDLRFQTHIENGIKWSMDCQEPPTPTPVPSTPVPPTPVPPTPVPPTPVPTNTPIPTAAPTLVPTATLMPTNTPTPIPATATPASADPAPTDPAPTDPAPTDPAPAETVASTATSIVSTSTPQPTSSSSTPMPTSSSSTPMPTAVMPTAEMPTAEPSAATPVQTVAPTTTAESVDPMVSFVSPIIGETVAPGTNLYVLANVSTAGGTPEHVDLYLNDEFVRQENFAPYEWGAPEQNDEALALLSGGSYELKVVVTYSDERSITETMSFSVGLLTPPTGSTATPTATPLTTTIPGGTEADHLLFFSIIEQGTTVEE